MVQIEEATGLAVVHYEPAVEIGALHLTSLLGGAASSSLRQGLLAIRRALRISRRAQRAKIGPGCLPGLHESEVVLARVGLQMGAVGVHHRLSTMPWSTAWRTISPSTRAITVTAMAVL